MLRALLLLAACDPALNMSTRETRRHIEGCSDAVDHLRKCCPEFGSFLSCSVLETWEGGGSSDLSAKESRCLLAAGCDAIEKGIAGGKGICGITFRSQRCR
jgi:hypothetical protein